MERLLLARRSFRSCAEACTFLHENSKDASASYFEPFAAGICVSYARPFMSADGLGPLPPDPYEKFIDRPELGILHGKVVGARNAIYAHYSPAQALDLLPKGYFPKARPRPTITFLKNDKLYYTVPLIGWDPDSLRGIADLCLYQIKRVEKDSRERITHLVAEGIGLASIKWTPIQAALMSFSFCWFSKATGEI